MNNNPINSIDPLGLSAISKLYKAFMKTAKKQGHKTFWKVHPKTGAAIINKRSVGTPNKVRITKTGRVVKNDALGFLRLEKHAHRVNGKEGIVKIDMKGTRDWGPKSDFTIASQKASEKLGIEINEKYMKDNNLVWHHVEDAETMIMAPKDAHDLGHVGGVAVVEALKKEAKIGMLKKIWGITSIMGVSLVGNTIEALEEDKNVIYPAMRDVLDATGVATIPLDYVEGYMEGQAAMTEDVIKNIGDAKENLNFRDKMLGKDEKTIKQRLKDAVNPDLKEKPKKKYDYSNPNYKEWARDKK